MMDLKEKRKIFFESLNEEEERKFFGIPVNEEIYIFSKENNIKNTEQLEAIVMNSENKKIIEREFYMKRFLISHNSKWKNIFDMIILILTGYLSIQLLYNVTFENGSSFFVVHYIIEGLFGIFIILTFFHKYQDPNTLEIIDSYKLIASNYICKGWFIIDIISIIPYEIFSQNISLFKLARLIRIPKILDILDVSRFEKLIDSLFSGSNYDKLIILFNLRYIFKVIRLMVIAIIITYFIGCFWYLYCDNMAIKHPENNFIHHYELENLSGIDKLIISCYFALTTLTTVGFGDYVAVNNSERIFAIFIMLLGVALFSYVMGSFTDLISSYDRRLGMSDKGSDLHNWLSLLGKFSKNKPFDSNLVKKIDLHFAYFWKNDRNNSLSKDDLHLKSLPKSLRMKVMEFLWGDVFNKFSNFFLYYPNNKDKFFKFYYNISFLLLPRRFLTGEFIYKPNEEIEEMYLLTEGYVEIGVSMLDSESSIKYCKIIKSIDWIGEFYSLFNVKSKYFYTAGSELKTFGINKFDLLKTIEKHPDLFSKIRTKAYRRYYDCIKVVMEKCYNEELNLFKIGSSNLSMNNVEYNFDVSLLLKLFSYSKKIIKMGLESINSFKKEFIKKLMRIKK